MSFCSLWELLLAEGASARCQGRVLGAGRSAVFVSFCSLSGLLLDAGRSAVCVSFFRIPPPPFLTVMF